MDDRRVRALTEQIELLVRATQEERRVLRRSARTLTGISLTLSLLIGVFALIHYSHFRSEWTEEKLALGFEKEMESLQPIASQEFQELGRHLLPIYAQTGREQFSRMAPEIGGRLRAEASHLGSQLQRDGNARLATVTERLAAHTEAVAFDAYPGLVDEAERQRLNESLHRTTQASIRRAADRFAERFAADVHALEQHIREFESTPTDASTTDLQRRFIQLWLRLLDAELEQR